jgi:catecholate siderophore receptor
MTILVRVVRAECAFLPAAALILSTTPQLFASTPVAPAVPGSLDLQVTDTSGGAVSDAIVLVQRADTSVLTASAMDLGRYHLDGLAPGHFVVTVAKPGFASWSKDVDVEPGRTLSITITLNADGISEHVTVEGASPYVPPTVVSGTRVPIHPLDLPQTVNAVPNALIEAQSALSMQDALINVPGVTPQLGEGRRDQVAIRGFSATNDVYLDGVRDDAKYYRDLSSLEQVEVVKGPAGALFGRGSSGGLVNRVTKKPIFGTRFGDVSLLAASYDHVRVEGDYVDGASSDRVAYRVTAAYENSNSNRPYYSLDRTAFSPSIGYRPRAGRELLVQADVLFDNRLPDRGIPSFQGRPLDEARPFYYGYPSDDFLRNRVGSLSATWQQSLGRSWTLRNTFRDIYYTNSFSNTLPGAVTELDDTRYVARSQYNSSGNQNNLFNQTDLATALSTGPLTHSLLIGLEVGLEQSTTLRFNGTASTVRVVNPVLRQPIYGTAAATDNEFAGRYAGVYVQDQIAIGDRWRALVGGRFDVNDQDLDDLRPANVDLGRVDTAFSPRAGLVFKAQQNVSIYGNVSSSFQPSGDGLSLATNNADLEPERTISYEGGVKTEVLRHHLTLTSALFRLDRSNVKTTDPLDPTRLVLVGRQRSNGVEFTAAGAILSGWNVSAGLTLLDPTILQSNDVTSGVPVQGNEIGNVARRSGSVWTTYSSTSGLTFGGGVFGFGDRFTSNDNLVTLPGYTRVDVMASQRLGSFELQLNLRNALGNTYYETAQGNNNIMPAAGRNGGVTVRYRF